MSKQDKENAPSINSSKSSRKARKLIVDYSKKMLTLEQLTRKTDGSSKKRKLAEITGNIEISRLTAKDLNREEENAEKEDGAAELKELFEQKMSLTPSQKPADL